MSLSWFFDGEHLCCAEPLSRYKQVRKERRASHNVQSVIGKKVNTGDFWYLTSLSFSRVSLPKENIKHPLKHCEVEQIYQLKRSFRFVPCHF